MMDCEDQTYKNIHSLYQLSEVSVKELDPLDKRRMKLRVVEVNKASRTM